MLHRFSFIIQKYGPCEKRIDSFHRRLLRSYVLNIKWTNVIKNEDVYKKTNTEQWLLAIKNGECVGSVTY